VAPAASGKMGVCAALTAAVTLAPTPSVAHCDGLDGPVVKAARLALETRNPALVLIWVQPNDESDIRTAFEQTLAVRALSPQAKKLADQFFFETLVRVHRAGEGAPFTGLKSAGRDLGPAIPAADRALENGSVEPVLQLLTATVSERLRDHFGAVRAAKTYNTSDLTAGREYVRQYVAFIHYVERLYEASLSAADGHFENEHPSTTR
jgi:hypothetical protein